MKKNAWDRKVQRARLVENQVLKWFRETIDNEARLVDGYFPDYDIYSKKGCVEVKEDRMAHQTGSYALEHRTHDGKPSGYSGTAAKFFVLVDWEYVCFVPTETLKQIIDLVEDKKAVNMGDIFDGGGRNKGYLIPRERILNNPLVQVSKRWFPVYND